MPLCPWTGEARWTSYVLSSLPALADECSLTAADTPPSRNLASREQCPCTGRSVLAHYHFISSQSVAVHSKMLLCACIEAMGNVITHAVISYTAHPRPSSSSNVVPATHSIHNVSVDLQAGSAALSVVCEAARVCGYRRHSTAGRSERSAVIQQAAGPGRVLSAVLIQQPGRAQCCQLCLSNSRAECCLPSCAHSTAGRAECSAVSCAPITHTTSERSAVPSDLIQ